MKKDTSVLEDEPLNKEDEEQSDHEEQSEEEQSHEEQSDHEEQSEEEQSDENNDFKKVIIDFITDIITTFPVNCTLNNDLQILLLIKIIKIWLF